MIKEEQGIVELTSKDDAPGGPEGAGVRPQDVVGDREDSRNED
ncbi:hypothetical protein AB6809_35725 [Paraburkholderia sp. RCC_158]